MFLTNLIQNKENSNSIVAARTVFQRRWAKQALALNIAQWNRLWEAAAKLDEAHIFIDDTPSHITELIVAKHRNGPTGRVTLFFKEDCTKFISLSRRRVIQ